ncbi:SLBB domain-containing protein [Rosettibacter firmus]|uniref:SLBB domain-containing protein n=1 Tax=Rosettibacter firmus TaxID=3111522 RepID=UPI00336C08D4
MRFIKFFIYFFVYLISYNLFAQDIEQTTSKTLQTSVMQPITVTVGGNFVVTGSFTAFRTQRLDHFITSLYNQAQEISLGAVNKPEIIKQIKKELQKYPLRDILLKRADGTQIKIDLLKFRLTGDFKYNPYLMNDDVIIFPSYDEKKNIVEISGAVNKPTQFQFVEGDKLSDAILFAGGINKAYDNVTEAEISRIKENGKAEEIIRVKISDDVPLQRGDRITILFNENNKTIFKVLVLGEVNRPGYVYITKNNTTIREVIEKAGGFTYDADLKRAEILKGTDESQIMKMKAIRDAYEADTSFTTLPLVLKTVDELKSEEIKMLRSANVTTEEFQYSFVYDNSLRFIENKSIIDFTKIFSDSAKDGNYIVNDGDIIIIPKKQNLVYVFGQVVNPGFYLYDSTKTWKDYINEAGGVTQTAKNGKQTQIIKGTNRTWFNAEDTIKIEPGDFIYVPKDLPRDLSYYIQNIGAVSGIVTALISITFLIIQATK